MSDSKNRTEHLKLSRRLALKAGAAAVAGIAAAPLLLKTNTASAAAKASKQSMKYQDHPNNGQQCSGCIQFIPGSSADAKGKCKVVAGDISPNGWCIAYAPKS